jgi:hypothetical protein
LNCAGRERETAEKAEGGNGGLQKAQGNIEQPTANNQQRTLNNQ